MPLHACRDRYVSAQALRPAARSHRPEGERAPRAAGAARERTGGRSFRARTRSGHRCAPAPARAAGLSQRDAQARAAARASFAGARPAPDARAVGGPAGPVGAGLSWRVARTAADLDGAERIDDRHVLEALGYRLSDAAA